jgi:hypothetical protein
MTSRINLASALGIAVGAVAISSVYAVPDAPPADSPEVKAERECRYVALKEYIQAKGALANTAMELAAKGALPSLESVLVERRLEEAYCQRDVMYQRLPPGNIGLAFGACLDDEARERMRY